MRHLSFNKFVNTGFGWFCENCSSKSSPNPSSEDVPSRLFLEGEADKTASIARPGRAVWKSKEDKILLCPDCGTSEVGEFEQE